MSVFAIQKSDGVCNLLEQLRACIASKYSDRLFQQTDEA